MTNEDGPSCFCVDCCVVAISALEGGKGRLKTTVRGLRTIRIRPNTLFSSWCIYNHRPVIHAHGRGFYCMQTRESGIMLLAMNKRVAPLVLGFWGCALAHSLYLYQMATGRRLPPRVRGAS